LKLTRLKESDVDAGSRVLARAFQDDPLQSYVFPDAAERAALSPVHFAPLIRYGLLAGEVWTTVDEVRGVAVWWPPAHREMNADALERSGFNKLPVAIGETAFGRFMGVMDYTDVIHYRDMPRPHWYAMVIGDDPLLQSRGVGSGLLQETCRQADFDGSPCYLETYQPTNVPFYQKNGFELVIHGVEPTSGLKYWTFKREPAA
jgi:GNAT superfamily N-acetyltransferase